MNKEYVFEVGATVECPFRWTDPDDYGPDQCLLKEMQKRHMKVSDTWCVGVTTLSGGCPVRNYTSIIVRKKGIGRGHKSEERSERREDSD